MLAASHPRLRAVDHCARAGRGAHLGSGHVRGAGQAQRGVCGSAAAVAEHVYGTH
jgi:hypothetical protein